MHYFFKNFLLLGLVLIFPLSLSAAEIRIVSPQEEIKTNEEFVVHVLLDSDESVNAVEGRIVYPTDKLEVKEIRDGNSVINFWIEKPQTDRTTRGTIVFSGITPGGFSGSNNTLFSLVFEATQTGNAEIEIQGSQVLLNDGEGSKAPLTIQNATLSVLEGDGTLHEENLTDTEPPEDFRPIISKDPSLYEGKYFLIFKTQDKGIGIDHYEVREGFWNKYATEDSPYLLKEQTLQKKVYVKAVDKAGNERVSVLPPQNPLPWYRRIEILGILVVLVIVVIGALKKTWSKFTR